MGAADGFGIKAGQGLSFHENLVRIQRAVRHGDAQHVGVKLEIEAVHEPVRAELLLGQFPGEAAGHLIAELLDARRGGR